MPVSSREFMSSVFTGNYLLVPAKNRHTEVGCRKHRLINPNLFPLNEIKHVLISISFC